MKGNWLNRLKYPLALVFLIGLVVFTSKSLAQEPPPSDVIVMSRDDLEAIKAEFEAMREQVRRAKKIASTCNQMI